MISDEMVHLLKLQSDSLLAAKAMREQWGHATKEERASLLERYIESRRKLPRLSNGKHLGHHEAYDQTKGNTK